ncbi:MAG: class I SAM-dependent methyltransferase [Promethearchaeota archaeon]|jgi:hypothetical protein
MDNNKCLLCQSEDYQVIFSYDEPDLYERAVGVEVEGYWRQWVQCVKCQFYYSRYSRPDDQLDNIYTSIYRSGASGWRNETTEEIFDRIISLPPKLSETKYRVGWIKSQLQNIWSAGFVKKGPTPHRMLDVGGASGVFAYEFRDKHWLPHVVDPSENGSFLQSRFGIPYVQKSYEPGCFDKPFDLITVIFVLEHLNNPVRFLKHVRKDMTADSLLFLEIPDSISFRCKPQNDDIFNSCHLWMFSPNTLLKLLEQVGFQIFSLHRTKTIREHYTLMLLGGLL